MNSFCFASSNKSEIIPNPYGFYMFSKAQNKFIYTVVVICNQKNTKNMNWIFFCMVKRYENTCFFNSQHKIFNLPPSKKLKRHKYNFFCELRKAHQTLLYFLQVTITQKTDITHMGFTSF